ncbi:acyl-CoA dehydrogenase family protein [Pseudonocardia sp. KRD-184]|uniref:Acyl-CoA dehydrogenase family protein n=1 Tax=Pseudonocardia oceani TaxID=2792013 RepID=A0ABS6U4B1_9PSEU|nr:acyl-CoA dehydrogenase family protein [Pseudonocardia oceani]MBW0090709.1 acyl-CoA dehydrogenase family protein [Pseudonocardia oceani]MBW0097603.1 acyl-CoA dehydrogenase family protein [Pseudonocardia oceani]MBW0124326.1 acyl-CoA dehydrogenase family protein [Pseudonocardia oceani]MBW0127072.1 acyl-CoA dehydrogenase family protein [Pseudonocardia oceani]
MTGFGVGQERDWSALDDEEFRALVRTDFEAHYPGHLRYPSRRLLWDEQRAWYERMSAKGWIAPGWPTGFGGMGLDPAKLLIFLDEQERHGIARFQDHGIRMIGPALIRYGSPEQQERFLPPILRCEHRYCQGYSEPEAGSDLASLRTTAHLVDDEWVVSGTKIWTTMAYDVTHMFLLARTGAAGAPQAQISFFLLDLASPGVVIRRIRDMAGEEELCEVFLDEVRIPRGNLVGEVDRGWSVAKSVLGFERIHVGSPQLPESGLQVLARVAAARGVVDSPEFADRFAALRLDVAHLGMAYAGYVRRLVDGHELGPDVSMLKLWATETFQRIADLVVEIAGPAGGVASPVDLGGRNLEILGPYYRARPSTIYGGSSEVQRNIIAKHVLGLPTA